MLIATDADHAHSHACCRSFHWLTFPLASGQTCMLSAFCEEDADDSPLAAKTRADMGCKLSEIPLEISVASGTAATESTFRPTSCEFWPL